MTNRIKKYFPDDEHGYECDCDGCQNCEPQQLPMVVVPLPALIQRDAERFDAGRKHESEISQAVIEGLRREQAVQVEAAYHEGKSMAHGLWLFAAAATVVLTVLIQGCQR